MKQADIHPCFSCVLPDCDEQSRRCGLRRAQNDYHHHRRSGGRIPEDVKARYAIAYRELYYDSKRERIARRARP